jgi:hypothetical protein
VASVLLLVLPPSLLGCTVRKLRDVAPVEAKPGERIVAVTTRVGHYVAFAGGGAVVRDGKVSGPGQPPVNIPAERIKRAVRGPNDSIVELATVDNEILRFTPPGVGLNPAGGVQGVVSFTYEVPLAEVQRLWVQRKTVSKGRTLALVALVGLLAIGIFAADEASKPPPESCPFVYSWDGTQYVRDAEPYGGATSRGLERDDYAELEHVRAEGGAYRLIATNEVPETQFTNLMELLVADHPGGTRVVADEAGNIHAVSDLRPPLSAVDREGRSLLPWLERTDGLIWEPEPVVDSRGELRRQLVLTFPRPDGVSGVKLVANAATGSWGSHMIRAMLALHGRELDAWYATLDGDAGARALLHAWNLREELYALKVEVEEPTGWEVRGILPGGGPVLAEDRLIPLDVSRTRGDRLRIRLRPPAGFWALNSFGMDYGADPPVPVTRLAPVEARDSRDASVLAELRAADDRYQVMPHIGDHVELVFPAPAPRDGMERTVFLHSRGYYRLHLVESGEPDRATLQQIANTPGAPTQFAADRFAEWRSRRP